MRNRLTMLKLLVCVTLCVVLINGTNAEEPRYIDGKAVYTINTPIYDRSDSRVLFEDFLLI